MGVYSALKRDSFLAKVFQAVSLIGISLPTYRRLERGQTPNPPLRYLVNCALALGYTTTEQLIELFEDDWLTAYDDAPLRPGVRRALERR